MRCTSHEITLRFVAPEGYEANFRTLDKVVENVSGLPGWRMYDRVEGYETELYEAYSWEYDDVEPADGVEPDASVIVFTFGASREMPLVMATRSDDWVYSATTMAGHLQKLVETLNPEPKYIRATQHKTFEVSETENLPF